MHGILPRFGAVALPLAALLVACDPSDGAAPDTPTPATVLPSATAPAVTGCTNLLDDDADAWTDASDPDCAIGVDEVGLRPDLPCNNGLDDDLDGLADGQDPDCGGADGTEGDLPSCFDGFDDDDDGWADQADPDCGPGLGAEAGLDPTWPCNNGLDDDLDSLTDADDPVCVSAFTGSEGSTPACTDALDNDGDGWVDLADPGCDVSVDIDEGGEDPSLPCNDGVDNDYDGLIDGFDDHCSDASATESDVDVLMPFGHVMLPVAAGTFDMGCTPGQGDCAPKCFAVHTVTLTRGFWLGRTEVTQAQYVEVIGSNPSLHPGCDDCPVEHVSWHEAAIFANALSDADGLENCFDCAYGACVSVADPYGCLGYRLPTEAEWEFGARCGEDTFHAGSDDFELVGWFWENAEGIPQPVATLAPNGCQLFDLSGNALEWVADTEVWPYPDFAAVDPYVPAWDEFHAYRGGSFSGNAYALYLAGRSATNGAGNTGFRLARTIP